MIAMTARQFRLLVKKGIEAIPVVFLKKIENVAIVVEDEPTKRQKKEMQIKDGHTLFGLYEGVPLPSRWGYGETLPDKITLFKNSILEEAHSKDEVKMIVKETVWHEIAHHFGLEDDEIEKIERKRKKTSYENPHS